MNLRDSFFGVIAVKNGLLTKEQLNDCLRIQEDGGEGAPSLGEICREHGYLTEDEVSKVLRAQAKSERILEDRLTGELAVRNGLLTQAQIDEVVDLQKGEGNGRPIGEILLERGLLTDQQLKAILRTQDRLKQESGRHRQA